MGALKWVGRTFDDSGIGLPLSPTRMGDSTLESFMRNRIRANNSDYIPDATVPNPRNPKPADLPKQRLDPKPEPIPSPKPLPKNPTPSIPKTPAPGDSLSLVAALSKIATNGEGLINAFWNEYGLNNRIVEVQNVLVDIRDAINNIPASLPDLSKFKMPDFKELLSPLSELTDIADTLIQSQNALVDVSNSIDIVSEKMPDPEQINILNRAKNESLEYDRTPFRLSLIDDAPVSVISPRDAKFLNNASNEIKARETNNFRPEEDDFGLDDLFDSITDIGYTGVYDSIIEVASHISNGTLEFSTNYSEADIPTYLIVGALI